MVDQLVGGQVAHYEPAALRAQAYTARFAYKQAISTYLYQWKQLTAVTGLRQLPLSEVSGRIDAAIPYYDYDAVLSHVLHQHTDVQTARNSIEKYRYSLKLAQVVPVPDVDVRAAVLKEYALPPQQFVHSVQVGVPIPIWDHNKGNIMAAEAGTHASERGAASRGDRADQQPGQRLHQLQEQSRRPRVLPRLHSSRSDSRFEGSAIVVREAIPMRPSADLITSQQTLVTSVQSYLGILGQIWTSVVGVADLLQTDDLFQLAEPKMLPPLPDLEGLPPLACNHSCVTEEPAHPVARRAASPAGQCNPSVAPWWRPAIARLSAPIPGAAVARSEYIPPTALTSSGDSVSKNAAGTRPSSPRASMRPCCRPSDSARRLQGLPEPA